MNIKNITYFFKDPKNTRMILFAGAIILLFLLLRQCNKSNELKALLEKEKSEIKRINNNYLAASDTIKKFAINGNIWRSEKLAYELTIDELNGKYEDILGSFELEKNRPPKVVIQIKYVIKEVIRDVPVYVLIDADGNTLLSFSNNKKYDSTNYRNLSGTIPYKISFNPIDSTYNVIPGNGEFLLEQGIGLNLGLFKDKKTGQVSIKVDTKYPGINFTRLDGAIIMDNPENKKIIRGLRKPFGIGLSFGYGLMVGSGKINTGPYLGIGINYSPKFLQFGE